MQNIRTISDNCTGCCACFSVCKQGAISMRENEEGFWYPCIDITKCNHCGLCNSVCAELNENNMGTFKQEAFYGWHKDEAVRRKSSSGGVFSALAEKTLNKKGIVFGAVHDLHQKKVRHASTEEYGLSAFRKSKYVQSYIGTSFRKAEGFLKEGKEIFFTGTPCQIAGFKTYLGKDYPNLLTCDFICHGVPSMKLLNDHLDLLENKFRADIVEVDFRPKTYGWSTHLLKCVFSDGAEYIKHHQFDAYIAAFYLNLSLRRSCYQCRYSDTQHRADLTVADYWGYRRFSPDINDEKGLSLIMANTGKGESAINESQNMVYRPVDWKYADYVFCRHDKENFYKERRDEFFNYYLDNGWKKTVLQYRLRGKWYLRVKRNIVHNILRKLNLV